MKKRSISKSKYLEKIYHPNKTECSNYLKLNRNIRKLFANLKAENF